jgi:hypothetical protein
MSTFGRAAYVLVIAIGAMGCSNLFFLKSRQPESPSRQTGPVTPAVPDRLRGNPTSGPPPVPASAPVRASAPDRASEPAAPREITQSARPVDVPSAQPTADPDPRAVIDWLLKERR